MSIIYKKTLKKNPVRPEDPGKYYPQIITMRQKLTMEQIIYDMKDKSSLSAGDIESVAINLIETMSRGLLSGNSVVIPKFGMFSLSAKSEGSDTEEECTAKKIKSLHVNFRPAPNLRPNLAATRAEDRVEFIDFVTYIKSLSLNGLSISDTTGEDGEDEGGGYVDPNA